MNLIRTIVICVCFISFSGGASHAQEWHGLRPLHSTCEDVKRVLGVTTCEPLNGFYEFEGENVRITFSKHSCELAFQKAWNVPPETILSIERLMKKRLSLSDLNVDLSKYKKELIRSDFNTVVYANEDEGISLWINEEIVSSINYAPTTKDEYLLCSNQPEPKTNQNKLELLSFWFDRYGDLPFSEEQKHLDLVAKELKEHTITTQVYIVVYVAQRSCKDKAQAHAQRAKDYLVKTHGVAPSRIQIITGEEGKGFETVIYFEPL